ncbi:MAG: 3-isopropylmalate dehydratase small subunit [Candidatus Caldatribacteriota bacterium]|nr:3-isopropylmalate dehydratase small subunit [Candidatus Caldatribacteriota bacterium]
MFEFIITCKVFKVGDDIDTDQIYPGRYLYLTSPEEIASHAMEDIIPDFSEKIAGEDWIIVAGKNFGCGSSREHAPRAILCAGIKAVVAESFGRIFYRNAINIGLPIVKCPGIVKKVHQGDLIQANLKEGLIILDISGETLSIEKFPLQLLSILKSGGLIPYLKKYKKYSHFDK